MANKLTFADSTHEVIKTEVIRPGVEGITPGVLVWYKYQRIKHIWPALVVEVLQKNKVKLQTKHSYDVLIARVSNTKSFRTYVPKWCRTQTWESMYNNPENREIVEDLNEAIKYMKHYDKENYKLLDADVKQFEQKFIKLIVINKKLIIYLLTSLLSTIFTVRYGKHMQRCYL